MNNFEALKQMPLKSFANMVFHAVKRDCRSLEEFEVFLEKEVPETLEGTLKEALQKMQCPDEN